MFDRRNEIVIIFRCSIEITKIDAQPYLIESLANQD